MLVLVWSEFGRRAEENGSHGTDHGAAGIGFLIGSRVRGQMLGEFPGLAPPASTTRATCARPPTTAALYCSLLEQWFGTDAAAVIPDAASFARPALLK